MKKSELRNLIKQTIKETRLPLNEQNQTFLDALLSNFTPVNGAWASHRNMLQGESIILTCTDNTGGPSAFQQGNASLFRGEFDVVTGGTPPDLDLQGGPETNPDFINNPPKQITIRCKGTQKAKDFATVPQNTDGELQVRHSCGVNGICQPDENGPFISLQACQQSGCGPDRERPMEPNSTYLGPTMRPYQGGPLEEIVKKTLLKIKNKK